MRLIALIPLLAVYFANAGPAVPPHAVAMPRPKAGGYTTNIRSAYVQGVSQVAGGCVGGGCSAGDFNPILLQGARGNPGIKARFNQRAFQYGSDLLAPILNQEIKRARLPNINQCIPQVSGCIQVYNLFVARYRCPQRIAVYPAPPNKVVLAVQNLDVGVDGNLGGQIVILLPLALTGIVHVNAHQVSITVELTINRAANGAPYIHMSSCHVQVGYLDAWIENGGLIGDIVNSQFRSKVSSQVKEMIPSKLCAQLPSIINEKINSKLGQIPQAIALTQMLQMAGLNNLGSSSAQCPAHCKAANPTAAVNTPISPPKSVPSAVQPPVNPPQPYETHPHARAIPQKPSTSQVVGVTGANGYRKRYVRVSAATKNAAPKIPARHLVSSGSTRQARSAGTAPPTAVAMPRPRAQSASTSQLAVASGNVCGNCPGAAEAANKDPLSSIADLAKYLDMTKLNDLYLTVQLVNDYATYNDYTIELNGEFSPLGRGGTPFGAFPMFFPPGGNRMAEALISDFTLNSLFYHMHRKGFLSFHVGPETPKIGELLKTTCSEEEDDLEDHGVEIDDGDNTRRLRRLKRQDDGGGLSDLGICFGDILPAIREKYPNKKIAINIRTVRAPSVLLSARNGGTATLDMIVDADIFIDGTNQRVGTITITATVEIRVQPRGNLIAGSLEITTLKLADKDGTLGLPQDALDNLGNLGKELLQKVGNDALQKGIPVQIPSNSALPINFVNPQFSIVEHGLYLQSDFTISPSVLASLGGGGGSSCGGFGRK